MSMKGKEVFAKFKGLHYRIKESKYKPWQIYFLSISILISTGLILDVNLIKSFVQGMEVFVSGFDWLVILSVQGIIIGFVAEGLYEQGDKYAKTGSDQFGSKDRTLMVRVGVMTLVSAIVTKVIPPMLEGFADYLVVQTFGAVIVLGILLVHTGSSEWKIKTEWPAIMGGVILALSPSLIW